MMFGSFVHLVASKFPALQIAVLIILKFMHFIKKVGDGQVDLEQIEKEKQHDAKKISEIWGAGFASAWTHTFITLPGDESRSPKQLQMGETVPNSEPMKQITAPFLDSCGDNAVDADDSKFMRFIKKVGDGQVVSPFLFVLNQHAQKIPEIWSADFASAWTYGLMFGYATDETEECMPLTVALAHRLNARLAALRKDGTFPWAGPDSKTQDGDGDMECPPRGSGPRNRPPYRSSPKDRRRPRRGRQSRPRADSGAPRGKRDDGDAPNKSDAADDYESKSDEPGNTHENNSDNVNVSPSSNQLSSGTGEPSDSAQTNEGYSNENSSEQERDDFLHKLTSVEDWLYGEGGRTGSCLQRKLNELK